MEEFMLTEQHLRLLRNTYISWNDMEYGAPTVDPKRPYGNEDVVDDICSLLLEGDDFDADSIHREMETALQIVCRFAGTAVEPGRYQMTRPYDVRSWERIGD
jgi:hypothetical protein